jgi:intein/homing endonuclease
MAYVLGFFAADGSMRITKRNTCFIEFQITDKELLERIREVLGSNNRIAVRERNPKWKLAYRLQIGSRILFDDLSRLGMLQNKSKIITLPNVPDAYFPDFLRGYFDGDGNVVFGRFKRSDCNTSRWIFSVRFTSGSRLFLEGVRDKLWDVLGVSGSLFWSSGWRLNYAGIASRKLFYFMYRGGNIERLIYLERKYKIFQDAIASKIALRP